MFVVTRKLAHAEIDLYEAHLLRLDHHDRAARFHAGITDEGIVRHCRRLRAAPAVWLFGAFIDGVLRAAAELHAEPQHWLDGAELALSVEGPFQGQGLGADLVRRALTVARNRGLHDVGMICLRDNYRIRRIASRFAAALAADESDMTAGMTLAPPTPQSFWQEILDDEAALALMAMAYWHQALEPFARSRAVA
ncbi:MAG: GNAT family N-acetyltransferase [Alphaproteobacteria bacterium]|jgi:GNAT superfamily N-acetyltransferase|nr:GNAT family N-acetyltransferase [Alphaproteobacteria bacterium]